MKMADSGNCQLYKLVLQHDKKQAETNYRLGLLATDFGKLEQGIPYLRQAIKYNQTTLNIGQNSSMLQHYSIVTTTLMSNSTVPKLKL